MEDAKGIGVGLAYQNAALGMAVVLVVDWLVLLSLPKLRQVWA